MPDAHRPTPTSDTAVVRSLTRSWPALPLVEWEATRDTLLLWTQIVGKVRMANEPLVSHWWNVPLYVTARGLTTSLISHPSGSAFQIDFDLHAHQLDIITTTGDHRGLALRSTPVSQFYAHVMGMLAELGVATEIWPMPVEIAGAIPFAEDNLHGTYQPDQAQRFWQALVQMMRVFKEFRARFIGKASPVHLFWGGLDLATTRFSGRRAPPYAGSVPNCGPGVMLEAYSHEVSSCGYWPGGGGEGLFYSYAYPEPPGFRHAAVGPRGARYSEELGEFVLPYEIVRTGSDPDRLLLEFLQSTYEAAAITAAWDRATLERDHD
jgi:hypothetical protein